MKAIWIDKFGDSTVLEIKNLMEPRPACDEVLVRLKAAGLNVIDIDMRQGMHQIALPFIPGVEAAGVVEVVGKNVVGIKPGDHVAYSGILGSYAEYNVVKASQLILLPKHMCFEDAAAFLFQGLAACHFIHKSEPIKKGSRVLVQAAAGDIGLILVQWLKSMGAYVIGTVSTETKANAVLEAGADQVIFYSTPNCIGKIDAVIGQPYELIPGLRLNTLKTGSSMDMYFNYAHEILNEIVQGHINIRINHVFPLEKIAEAQRLLSDRKRIGKIILKIDMK